MTIKYLNFHVKEKQAFHLSQTEDTEKSYVCHSKNC